MGKKSLLSGGKIKCELWVLVQLPAQFNQFIEKIIGSN